MALQFLPWLIRAGQGLASATGAKGVARGAAKYLDPRKVPLEKGKRYDVVNNVVQARTRRGAIPNYLSQPGFGPTAIKAGLTLGGGSIAAERIASMMRDDEVSPDATAPVGVGSYTPAPGASMPTDFESRLAFEQRKSKKMNKQMKRLLQYYGIINLINPDSASDMLKLGTAMLEQEIGQMGTDRQAKIFDAIFKDGSMPRSGAEAAKMILNAGGTPEDVADITDIYESITPTKAKTSEDERAVEDILRAKSLVEQGYDTEALDLLERAILSKRIKSAKSEIGVDIPPRKQAELIIAEWVRERKRIRGSAEGGLDSSLFKIEKYLD